MGVDVIGWSYRVLIKFNENPRGYNIDFTKSKGHLIIFLHMWHDKRSVKEREKNIKFTAKSSDWMTNTW